ncbi:kinase-like protein [Phlegmacium glaucopus]|nr:kinase-like protein [Phlegmacium glaucopus]
MTASILTVIFQILWAAQCIGGNQIRNGIVQTDDVKPYNVLILCIFMAFMAISLHVMGTLGAVAFSINNQERTTTAAATSGLIDDSDVETETENRAGAAITPSKGKETRGNIEITKARVLAGEQAIGSSAETDKIKDPEGEKTVSISTTSPSIPLATPAPSLINLVSILGYGSQGTVVFQGSFQGRPVAVKRLLRDFVTLATREVSILQQSDDHPNVIRYYYQESQLDFHYIVLQLCPASLVDIIEIRRGSEGLTESDSRREEWKDIAREFDPKRAMRQMTSGVRHLHGLGLVHRDIKPQNVLVSSSGGRGGTGYRMLISDFGLCKKLDMDQTSFLPTTNGAMAAGTVGWRAPEILLGEAKLDELSTGEHNSTSSPSPGTTATTPTTRLTKSVDIFALGCVFYYILTNGGHPYGDRFEREVNIINDNKDLSLLPIKEATEAYDLITSMLHPQPPQRPDIKICLLHPFFWDPAKRLGFLQDASDRFEVMCRDPKDAALIRLERDAGNVVGDDWHQRLDTVLVENLGKYRKYDGKSVHDLLRALRNKKNHYQDLPDNVKVNLGPMPEGFLGYFTCRYPKLFMHVHGVVKDTGLHCESMFRTYFELPKP